MELQITPRKRPRLSEEALSTTQCVFCGGAFTKRNKQVTAAKDKLDTLFECARRRRDQASELILMNEDGIRKGNKALVYHRSCRASFASPQHVLRQCSEEQGGETSKGQTDQRPSTRSRVALSDE